MKNIQDIFYENLHVFFDLAALLNLVILYKYLVLRRHTVDHPNFFPLKLRIQPFAVQRCFSTSLERAKKKQQNSTEALRCIIYTSLNCEIVFLLNISP